LLQQRWPPMAVLIELLLFRYDWSHHSWYAPFAPRSWWSNQHL